jgi:hypothetical protein
MNLETLNKPVSFNRTLPAEAQLLSMVRPEHMEVAVRLMQDIKKEMFDDGFFGAKQAVLAQLEMAKSKSYFVHDKAVRCEYSSEFTVESEDQWGNTQSESSTAECGAAAFAYIEGVGNLCHDHWKNR